jgi:hypothetical protein
MKQSEFKALKRNENGDIIDLADIFYRLSPIQIEALSEDDYSRYDDLCEELSFEASEFM